VQTNIGANTTAAETKFGEEYILQKHRFMIAYTIEIEKIKLLAQTLMNGSGILGAEEIKKILGPRPERPATPLV
jgi:hypothetical protein